MIPCDRCGPNVRAVCLVVTKLGTLGFCQHCFDKNAVAFLTRRYEVINV